MKNIVIATMIAAAGFATLGTQAANAGGGYKNSYAYQYCHYYKARALGARTIALTGAGGGKCAALADVCVAVPSSCTPRIQELHITVIHAVSELVDRWADVDQSSR